MGVFKRDRIWWIDYSFQGTRVRESTGTRSKKRALQLLAKRQAAIFEGRFDVTTVRPSPLFGEYAITYLAYSKINKRPQSYRRDQTSIAHLKVFFGRQRLNDIQPMLIEHYKRKRLELGRKPATVNLELACMKHLYSLAVRDKLAVLNPVKQVRFLKKDNAITRVLSRADEDKLLACAAPHIRNFLVCALDTGMRLGEILGLQWGNVDLVKGIVRVEKTKTGRSREIPISRRLKEVFVTTKRGNSTENVFARKNGNPIRSVREGYAVALERAGLTNKRYRIHDLRHTFATRLVEQDVQLFTIQVLLGHSTIVTTQRYAHPGDGARRDAINRLEAVLDLPEEVESAQEDVT